MEDRFVIGDVDHLSLCAVFDGHGGTTVADHASGAVFRLVATAVNRRNEPFWPSIFSGLDLDIEGCGSAATIVAQHDRALSLAWVGDSRVLYLRAKSYDFITRPHRIDYPAELARVVRAGAEIRPPYVVNPATSRGLMITRSLGDRDLRQIGIISEPEIYSFEPAAEDLGIVVATDGLWDIASAPEVNDLCRGSEAQGAADALIRLIIDRRGRDNTTVIVRIF